MQDIFGRMQEIIAEQFGVDEDSITENTSFEDLGADSVDLVELVMAMEDEFKIGEVGEDELSDLSTVGDCVNFRKAGQLICECNKESLAADRMWSDRRGFLYGKENF